MGKKILYLILFLFIFALIFSLLDYKGEYLAEKKLVSVNKLLSDTMATPEAIPPGLYEKIAAQYGKIIRGHPKTKSSRQARILLGKLYIVKSDFNKAREVLNEILQKYPENKDYCAEALFTIGNSYEAEDKWDKAVSTYENIMTNFVGTLRSLNTPLYIAAYYAKKNDAKNKNIYLKKALSYYQNLNKEYPNTRIGYMASNLEITTLQNLGKWSESLDKLTSLIKTYPQALNLIRRLQMVELISIGKLRNPQRAIDIYEEFVSKYPRHKLNKLILEEIEKIKNKIKESNSDAE